MKKVFLAAVFSMGAIGVSGPTSAQIAVAKTNAGNPFLQARVATAPEYALWKMLNSNQATQGIAQRFAALNSQGKVSISSSAEALKYLGKLPPALLKSFGNSEAEIAARFDAILDEAVLTESRDIAPDTAEATYESIAPTAAAAVQGVECSLPSAAVSQAASTLSEQEIMAIQFTVKMNGHAMGQVGNDMKGLLNNPELRDAVANVNAESFASYLAIAEQQLADGVLTPVEAQNGWSCAFKQGVRRVGETAAAQQGLSPEEGIQMAKGIESACSVTWGANPNAICQ